MRTAWNAGLQTGTRGAPHRARHKADLPDGALLAVQLISRYAPGRATSRGPKLRHARRGAPRCRSGDRRSKRWARSGDGGVATGVVRRAACAGLETGVPSRTRHLHVKRHPKRGRWRQIQRGHPRGWEVFTRSPPRSWVVGCRREMGGARIPANPGAPDGARGTDRCGSVQVSFTPAGSACSRFSTPRSAPLTSPFWPEFAIDGQMSQTWPKRADAPGFLALSRGGRQRNPAPGRGYRTNRK